MAWWRNGVRLGSRLAALVALLCTVLLVGVAAAAPTVASFQASPNSLPRTGGTIQLLAVVTSATSCKFSSSSTIAGLPTTIPCSTGTTSVSVSLPSNPALVTKTYTFNLVVTQSGGGSVTATPVTATVAPTPAPAASSFTATPVSLPNAGGAVKLAATVSYTTTCKFSAAPAVVGLPTSVPCSAGSATVTIALPANANLSTKTYTFKLTMSRVGGGSVVAPSAQVGVAATPPPAVVSFGVAPKALPAGGGTVNLSASVVRATTCTFSVTPTFPGAPVTLPCSNGSAAASLAVPANPGTSAKTYTFKVTASRIGGGSVISSGVTVTVPPSPPCGSASTPPPTYHHVVVVMMENRTWSDVGGVGFGDPAMPYLHSLAGACTTFSDWTETDTSQNSLTQYIGLTSGVSNPSTVDDCDPSTTCRSTDDNVFRQVRVAGGTARSYVQGATAGCSASGNAAKHVPALYYYGTYADATGSHNDHDFCTAEVRPLSELDVTNLPTFALITPTLCNDGHDCGNAKVDTFAKTWLSKVLASASYASGDTAVFVMYDEDHPVPNLLIAPTAHMGTLSTAGAGQAAMLKTWEQMLGVPVLATPLLNAAPSLRGPAHL